MQYLSKKKKNLCKIYAFAVITVSFLVAYESVLWPSVKVFSDRKAVWCIALTSGL